MSQFSRRSLVHGAAWAAPAAAAAFAAPAFAASASENRNITPKITQYVGIHNQRAGGWITPPSDPRLYISTYGTAPVNAINPTLSRDSRVGMRWDGTSTGTSITNVMYTYYAPVTNLAFQTTTGHSSCWTLLTRDASQPNVRHASAGTTLYAYTAYYTCPITAASPTTTIQPFSYRSTTQYPETTTNVLWGRRLSYTLNGVPGEVVDLLGNLT